MKAINIEISKLNNNNGQIKDVPKNPRFLRDAKFEKLKKSIQDFPEMLAYREIVCYDNDGEYVVIGGNMRLRACKDLGYKEVPCKICKIKNKIAITFNEITICYECLKFLKNLAQINQRNIYAEIEHQTLFLKQ